MRRFAGTIAALLLLQAAASSPLRAGPRAEAPAARAAAAASERLHGEIARIAATTGGVVGVSALHIESGLSVSMNDRERFPMASVYKIPIAVRILTLVDRGELSLDRMVDIAPGDLRPSSALTTLLSRPGVSLSIGNLLELMLLISDNSASDILMRVAGGPEAVTARLREIGIEEMDVHRPTIRLLEDQAGVTLPAEPQWRPGLLDSLERAAPPESVAAAALRFETDPRDTATPDAIVALLKWIHAGEGLTAGSRSLLLDIMERCQTGDARLKGMLPDETAVAHKTGTIGGTANDAGIITLPDGAGHVAIAVCVKGSDREIAGRERAIAHIARAIYDYFLFRPAVTGP